MTQRLRISGRIDAEGRFTLRPAFLTRIPPNQWRHEPVTYLAEAQDAEGRVLTRVPLSSALTSGDGDSISVRGSIDLPDDTAQVAFLRSDPSARDPIILGTEFLPEQPPELHFTAVPEGEVEGTIEIAWEAQGEPKPERFFVDYCVDGELWEPLSYGLTEPHLVVDVNQMAGGDECRIAVTASNGLRATRIESAPFRVPLAPCAAVIVMPADGDSITGPGVTLVGNGWWREESRAELEALAWASDMQGELGEGREVRVDLEPGHHTITLRAGHGERIGSESVAITVI